MPLIDALRLLIPTDRLLLNESMARHTTFRIGGAADACVLPETADELMKTVELCREFDSPFYVLGDGANVLVSDEGVRGVVIFSRFLNFIGVSGNVLTAGAGVKLAKAADSACKAGLSGLEFASGIPGTVGGGLYMNAGAYGHDIKDVCVSVDAYADGSAVTLSKDDMKFDYRNSVLQLNGWIAVSAAFELRRGSAADIKTEMDGLAEKRRASQPLEYPSAGSTFKRPAGFFAGKLISDCGLKGFRVGGAQVSEKHAGFVINTGGATADDVKRLIEYVQNTVRERFNVELEPEVRFI